ncbi:aminoglycoside phosphotransferase family protein [Mesorhizobium loti]|uniref:Aminoglycoside phosphotransferase family protein n=1 Tax=Mesorhizobium loti R88b TaxID=935548 RepID=A0A6M7WRH6_RHILI|nr:aminoglycoside phosphotransferase family protein [Mesorhizobium loti]QKD04667.1 aminoglycoside phosphotransferase family protein [Mesorhizobium loti R88b]
MAGKLNIDTALVSRLVAAQFPQWKDLAVRPVEFGGWDNRTFHLGDEMTVRLPSAADYALQVEKEHRWLPKLAPLLPLPIPRPFAMGMPAEDYPWHWSVYGWIEGETAKRERISGLSQFAADLAGFLVALKRVDPTGGPAPGQHNFFRGGPLAVYDGETRRAITALGNHIGASLASAVWDAALAATWKGPPVWFHGDVSWGNLLVEAGRLSAVIDFGTCGVGDPSCDLAIAWTLFEGESREVFRTGLAVDDATWARGRGWALWKALITVAGHANNQAEVEKSRRVIDDVLAD